jgi:PAS domain S-box-containing protein
MRSSNFAPSMPTEPVHEPVITTNLEGRIQWCNPPAEREFGYGSGELVGEFIDVLIPDEARHEERELLGRLRQGECVYRAPSVGMRRDKRRLELALTILPSRDSSGNVTGVTRIYHPPLRADGEGVAEAYLAAIVDSADDAILSKDLDGNIRTCNRSAERLFGYTAAELIGRPVRMLIPPDRQAEEDDILARLHRGERVDHFETKRLTRDGRLVDISLTVSPVRDAAGTIVGASKIARDITEHRQLTLARAYLAAIVDSADDAIISKDLNGVIQSCNSAAERLFGYASSELLGRSVRMLIPPERQFEEDDILAHLRRGERVDHFETVRVAKDGRRLDISLTISPVRDASGTIIGASKIARDVTAQRRAAADLAAQQEWFRVTLASIGDAVIAADATGQVSYMNAAAERLTEWPLASAQGRPLGEVFQIVNEETREPIENPAGLVMRLGEIVGLANHTLLIGRSGTEYPIADSAAPIRDSNGRMLGVVLVFRDVTEERRAADAIAEQREWFERTLESIGDAVIATDVQGRTVFMNPVAEHLTGWAADAALGRPTHEVFVIMNEQTRRPVESPVTRVLAEGAVVGLANHTVLIAADGTERPIDDSGAPIRNREGRMVGTVLVFRDVTERHRAEVERQLAAAERERLLEAERMARADAERSSRVKDEFVAMVSHELRTPLNAILGWTQLTLKASHDQRAVQRGLEVIARNTRVQAQLIADLLDVSRIVSGKITLDIQPVNLAATILDAVETVQQEAVAKGVELRTDLAQAVGVVAGDAARLQQIVWNLLSNAIKFTPSGGHVAVTLRGMPGQAQITVVDDGVGIRPDFLPHVFDRFHQADRSITRKFGGLGLGLSIVKHLIGLHGGTVHAESAGEGLGATFIVTLPTAALATEDPVQREPSGIATGTEVLAGVRILVVEDDADTREFLCRLLDSHGALVVTAASATEALDHFRRSPPQILLSDIGLPEMDGYELIQRIRQHAPSGGATIPAIALTAYARSDDRTRALRAGYQAHVVKPVEAAELLATIQSFAAFIQASDRR